MNTHDIYIVTVTKLEISDTFHDGRAERMREGWSVASGIEKAVSSTDNNVVSVTTLLVTDTEPKVVV